MGNVPLAPLPLIIIGEGLTVVSDPGSPITNLYNPLCDFTGGFKSDRRCVEYDFEDVEGNKGFR